MTHTVCQGVQRRFGVTGGLEVIAMPREYVPGLSCILQLLVMPL